MQFSEKIQIFQSSQQYYKARPYCFIEILGRKIMELLKIYMEMNIIREERISW